MKYLFILAAFFSSFTGFSQNIPFNIVIEPLNIPNLGGLQAYSYGQSDGKWLVLGGRLDGLHQRQPFAAFDVAGHNIQLIVVDPVLGQTWTAPLSSLAISIQEQLSSTNMEFHQEGDYLYCIGGYGYSSTLADHTTYPYLTAINVSATINAIISNANFTSYFRQLNDSAFAVTGGHLSKINNTYYLVGGQKFIGRYNPMGPTQGPGFFQEYTNSIRKFNINDNGTSISVNHLPTITDTVNLHRRDYNVVEQIMPNGTEGLTAFSGVFQYGIDLPFLNSVDIDSNSYSVNNAFTQYYNHYHCATIPLFSESLNEMHNVFFGGIAQYYDSLGMLVQDNNVPFVKTIARVTRNAAGNVAEYKLPVEMPSLMGAGSEFIRLPNLHEFPNGVLKLDSLLTNDSTLIGYIYGGINSSAQNIFFINTGIESIASNVIFKVYLLKGTTSNIHKLNDQSTGTLKIIVFPNPNTGKFTTKYSIKKTTDVNIRLSDINGKIIEEKHLLNQLPGEYIYENNNANYDEPGSYFLSIETIYEKATQKIIIDP